MSVTLHLGRFSALSCLLLSGCGGSGLPDNPPLKLGSHIPQVVALSRRMQRTAADTTLALRVVLPLRNEDELDASLEALYDPNSPTYHQYLTPAAFAAQYHPTDDDVEQVKTTLRNAGMEFVDLHGATLNIVTRADTAEKFFSTQLYDYTAPNGDAFRAPEQDIVIPDGLSIQAVHGLFSGLPRQSHLVLQPNGGSIFPGQSDPPGTKHSAGFNAQQIRKMYDIPTALQGDGQVIGLFEFDGYDPSDIAGYEKANGLPNVPLVNVLVDKFNGKPGRTADEVTLDIEMAIAMAPKAKQIRVYETSNNDTDLLNEMANPSQGDKMLVNVISCSFGNAEDQVSAATMQSDASLFKQMARQGQSFFDASGDAGAQDDGRTLSIDEYAGQPYVVAVGGTSIKVSSDGTYGSETAWAGSGGGVSQRWPIPTWQTGGVVSAATRGSQTMRNVPDVSLNADPQTGYAYFFQGSMQPGGGGTSFSAPLWAGFAALVNQQRAASGQPPVGFITPALYRIAASAQYAESFNDVADGSDNGYYPAIKGFDNVTGFGTIRGQALLGALQSGAENFAGDTTTPSGSATSSTVPATGSAAGSSPTTTTTPTATASAADGGQTSGSCSNLGGEIPAWVGITLAVMALRRRRSRL